MADTTYYNPNANLQTQGLNTSTAPIAPIAGTPFSPTQQIQAQMQNAQIMNNQAQTNGTPLPYTPTVNATISPTVATANPNTNVNMAFGATNTNPNQNMSLADKYNLAHQTAQATGQEVPATTGQGMAGVQSNLPQSTAQDQAQFDQQKQIQNITNTLQNDAGYQQLIKDQQEYLSSQNQQQTLQQQYDSMMQKAGIPAMNTQLMNMKNVIDGTEQDIRNEITKAGGFATESQVMALTSARNKTLIQNYNNLLNTKTDLENQIEKSMSFATQDRAQATALAAEKMNFDKQIIEYTQKMTDNAKAAYQKIIDTPGYGYKALYASTGGDKHTIGLIENTLGLPKGSLAQLSQIPDASKTQVVKLDNGSTILINSQTGQTIKNLGGSNGTSGGQADTLPPDPQSQSILRQTGLSIAAFNYLTQGSSSMARMDQNTRQKIMNEAQNWANKNGIDISTFKSQYEAYNDALQKNISRVNQVKVAEGELGGTLQNLASAADDASFKNMKWANVAKLFAGQQFNDANVSKYAFHLNQLRSELALYNAAASGKTSTDQADYNEAERIIKDGFAKGSITGFQQALTNSVSKMDSVLQQNVQRTQGQVWDLFGVKKPTTQTQSTKTVIPATQIPSGYYQASDGLLYKK